MQSPILINRFMINLNSLGSSQAYDTSSQELSRSRLTVLNFRIPESFLGNIGEDLAYCHNDAADDDIATEVPADHLLK